MPSSKKILNASTFSTSLIFPQVYSMEQTELLDLISYYYDDTTAMQTPIHIETSVFC